MSHQEFHLEFYYVPPTIGYWECPKHGVVDSFPCPIGNRAFKYQESFCPPPKGQIAAIVNCLTCNIVCRVYDFLPLPAYVCLVCQEKNYRIDKNAERFSTKYYIKSRSKDEYGLRPNGNDAYIAFNRSMEALINSTIKEKRKIRNA